MLNDAGSPVRLVSPAENDATERRGLMLRLMATADLGTDHEGGPIRVDRDSFAELFERLAPRVDVEAPDRVGSGKKTLACSFAVQGMDGLHPDSIVQEVPVLRSLVDARELLEKCLAHEV